MPEVAGMDGNRTHPGRLSSAPQTVLKTAGLASRDVHPRPLKLNQGHRQSAAFRSCPQSSARLAVILAVGETGGASSGVLSRADPPYVAKSVSMEFGPEAM